MGQIVTVETDASLAGSIAPADAIEQTGLAGAVGSNDGNKSAGRYCDRRIAESLDPAERQNKVPDIKQRRGHVRLPGLF